MHMESSDEDEEEAAPYSSVNMHEPEELSLFRQQWQLELQLQSTNKVQNALSVDAETKAKTFFSQGIAAERHGNHYQAISYYRQAIQLVPDIEHKMCYNDATTSGTETHEVGTSNLSSQLVENFQHLSLFVTCSPDIPTTQAHISCLPQEIMITILRWTVSSDLHLQCLEQVSMVCKGFYLLARQPSIWRLACTKLWGRDCVPSSYGGSWRHMFITRPHPHFHGLYISECSYVRQGEASLDRFYRPFHTVVYYRYLRFFSNGRVLYLTSPEDPASCVSKIKGYGDHQSLLGGHYTISDNDEDRRLSVVVHAHCLQHSPLAGSNRRHHHRNTSSKMEVTHEQNFHMEFVLRGRRFNQFTWVDHYCHTFNRRSGVSNVSHFEIDRKYCPFWFSRVRSYTNNTIGILC
ncbi:F-box only protein 9-like [Dysidea avara]|uniref:F-box only protein 9-like n=1 Tax=Dysidea avara TaxID=196820 RepID=UPI00332B4F2C